MSLPKEQLKKIRTGDRIRTTLTVMGVRGPGELLAVETGVGEYGLLDAHLVEAIFSPAPKPDTWANLKGAKVWVVAVDGGMAWVKYDTGSHTTCHVSDLERV